MFNKISKSEIDELKQRINNLNSWIDFFIRQKAESDKKIVNIKEEIKSISEKIKKLEKE